MGGWIGIDMFGVRNPRLLFDGPYGERDRPWVNTLCYSSADQDSHHERWTYVALSPASIVRHDLVSDRVLRADGGDGEGVESRFG